MNTVYLAGPIGGLSYGEATDWRTKVTQKLAENNIKALSPMRCKEYLSHFTNLPTTCEAYAPYSCLSSAKGIISRDRFDCTRCDVLFVNLLEAKKVSIGTMMEIAWADLSRIPIVCVIEENGNLHDHAMVQEAINFRVTSVDEGIKVTKAILV